MEWGDTTQDTARGSKFGIVRPDAPQKSVRSTRTILPYQPKGTEHIQHTYTCAHALAGPHSAGLHPRPRTLTHPRPRTCDVMVPSAAVAFASTASSFCPSARVPAFFSADGVRVHLAPCFACRWWRTARVKSDTTNAREVQRNCRVRAQQNTGMDCAIQSKAPVQCPFERRSSPVFLLCPSLLSIAIWTWETVQSRPCDFAHLHIVVGTKKSL